MDEETVHLRFRDGLAACGKKVDDYVLSDTTEDVDCGACRRTRQFKALAAQEGYE